MKSNSMQVSQWLGEQNILQVLPKVQKEPRYCLCNGITNSASDVATVFCAHRHFKGHCFSSLFKQTCEIVLTLRQHIQREVGFSRGGFQILSQALFQGGFVTQALLSIKLQFHVTDENQPWRCSSLPKTKYFQKDLCAKFSLNLGRIVTWDTLTSSPPSIYKINGDVGHSKMQLATPLSFFFFNLPQINVSPSYVFKCCHLLYL